MESMSSQDASGTLSPLELEQVLHEFNSTVADYPREALIPELFEKQVRQAPNAVAVLHRGRRLTYDELNKRANRVARYLRARGVGPDQLVGIFVGRGLDMVVGLLGILKAGGAYLPLDPHYPADRLQQMLSDAAPQIVLTQDDLRLSLPATQAGVITLEEVLQSLEGTRADDLPAAELGLTARDLVYVIYTSGSTGRPKGTGMPHGAMVNLVEWHRRMFGNGAGTRTLQFAALSFDVAFQEIFVTLGTGGALVLLDEWVRRDVRALIDLLRNERIQRLFVPPLMLQNLAEVSTATHIIPQHLQHVITAGEQLRVTPQIVDLFKRLEGCRLHNHYGPTETHVVTALTLTGDPDQWPVLPAIGRPIANTQIYILDNLRRPVGVGEPGEIYIGGAGVARGYLGRPDLTTQRFVLDPFSPGGRLYKTGDLGRWRPDGTLDYLGRNDDQVKIRGFRIEPGEIEAQLARHCHVREAAVVAREDVAGDKRLVAYVTSRGGSQPSVDELHAHLKAALPEYMVPSAFVALPSLPLTPSGKLDRRALPAPDTGAYVRRQYEPPQGEVEEILARTWQELLQIDSVGRNDNFLALGGHSLLIMRMAERLRVAGLSVEVRHIFESATLADLGRKLTRGGPEAFEVPPNRVPHGCEEITPQMLSLVKLDPEQIARVVQSIPGGAANIQDVYPLTPLQEGMLFHHLLEEQGGDTYVLLTVLSVASRERLEELIAALQAVVDRHDILRTAILWEGLEQPLQVVYRQATLPVEALAVEPGLGLPEQIEEWSRPERQRLDLTRAPLIKLRIAEDPHSGRWYALLQVHHLIDDDISVQIVVSEVVAHLRGHADTLSEPVPYRDHVAYALAVAREHDSEMFFRRKLGDVDEPAAPFGLADVRGKGLRIDKSAQELDLGLSQRLRTQARRLSTTAATLFHAAWGLVVARAAGREDVVFGSVLLGRLQGGLGAQRAVGMFINTLPLRLRLRDVTCQEFVEQTQREMVELLSHEQASLAMAQRCSGVGGSVPLFNSVLNYRQAGAQPEKGWGDADGIRLLACHYRSSYPLSLAVDDVGSGFVLTAQAPRDVGPSTVIGYMRTALLSLVEALEQDPQRPARALTILPEKERYDLLRLSNSTPTSFPDDKLIHQLFEEQARRTPLAVAVTANGQSLTFSQLNARANQLARSLRDRGVGPDELVGISVERSLELIVGLMGILKAGGAYVPLDPDYPKERIAYMVKDAAPRVILTQLRLKERLPPTSAEVICLDDDWNEIAGKADDNLDCLAVRSGHLAYVIYTSGSTGQPKGVMVEHRNVVSLWQSLEQIYRRSQRCQNVAVNAPFNFDGSVKQIVQLLSGRTLVVIPQKLRWDPRGLLELLDESDIHCIDCTPTQLKSWVSEGLLERGRSPLRVVLVGGEPIDPPLWSRLSRCAEIAFYNVYGPTESTVDATMAPLSGDTGGPHIGRPMENRQILIVDPNGELVPRGVAGELYIGGAGVARGYLNLPELTSQRFIDNPFSTGAGGRLYKSGDLGRWRADGTLEYLGRNDDQVKIRGYRIELGEIESQLKRHARVSDAVVIAREDHGTDKRLVGYVVPVSASASGSHAALRVEELRVYLKERLADYMVPSAIVVLDRLPLTMSGKVDRRSLPPPEESAYARPQYQAPEGEVEATLADIWQRLLRLDRLGRDDNFFELGGHSLLAMQVAVRIRSSLSVEMPMTWLFDFPTLRQLAGQVDELRQARLLQEIADGGHDVEQLLAEVAAMPERKVQDLVRELTVGGLGR